MARPLDPPAAPDANNLPAGIWEPDPGSGRVEVSLVADGAGVWFAATRRSYVQGVADDHVWLTKTTPFGERLIAPTQVDAPGNTAMRPVVARNDRGIAVAFARHEVGSQVFVRVFDRDGMPLRESEHRARIAVNDRDVDQVHVLRLLVSDSGPMSLIATFEDSVATTEVASIGLDPAGDPTGAATFMGTSDDGYPMRLAAALADDGSALIAWDRNYSQCTGYKPSLTLTGTVDALGSPGPSLSVFDVPNTSEAEPTIAAKGQTAYVAWFADRTVRSVISLSRYSDLSSVAVEIGDADERNQAPVLALSEPGRGAIAWATDDPYLLHVASLRDIGTSVIVGTPHVIPLVTPEGQLVSVSGLVHVGDDRYVLAWSEDATTSSGARVYATAVDLSQDSARVTPASRHRTADGRSVAPSRPQPIGFIPPRCTH